MQGNARAIPIDRRKMLIGAAAIFLPAANRARAQGLSPFRVAVGTAPVEANHHYYFYAKERGYYKDVGLDVTIRAVQGDVNVIRSLVAGDLDVGNVGAYATFAAVNAGAKVKVIGAFTPHFDSSIGGRRDIADLKSLEGRSFAVSGIGNIAQVGPMMCIEAAGGNPDRVKWVTVGSGAARLQGLIAGGFDATVFDTIYSRRIANYPKLHVIADEGRILPKFVYTWEVASPAALRNRKKLTDFMIATARGARWGMDNPDEAIKISQKYLPDVSKDDLVFQLTGYAKDKHWVADGMLPKDDWDFTVSGLLRHKLIDSAPSFADVTVADYALAAREALKTSG